MSHRLILEIPEDVYEPLVKTAAQIRQTPEKLAIHWLAAATQQQVDDPLEKFIGAFSKSGHSGGKLGEITIAAELLR